MRSFRADQVPEPRSPAFILPRLPLDLEIGCGVGMHPILYAQAHPERYLVAIEHTAVKFASFAGRVRHHPTIDNLYPVHANAIAWVTHRLPPCCVERIFILYPNPRPRWTSLPFFSRLAEVLKPGGTLQLATNLADYASEARRQVPADFGLTLVHDTVIEPTALGEGYRPRTHFEKKYLIRGERCFDLTFCKQP